MKDQERAPAAPPAGVDLEMRVLAIIQSVQTQGKHPHVAAMEVMRWLRATPSPTAAGALDLEAVENILWDLVSQAHRLEEGDTEAAEATVRAAALKIFATPPAGPAVDLEAEVYTESSPEGNAVGLRLGSMTATLSFSAAMLMARNLVEAVAEQTGDEEFARLEQSAERQPHGPFFTRDTPGGAAHG